MTEARQVPLRLPVLVASSASGSRRNSIGTTPALVPPVPDSDELRRATYPTPYRLPTLMDTRRRSLIYGESRSRSSSRRSSMETDSVMSNKSVHWKDEQCRCESEISIAKIHSDKVVCKVESVPGILRKMTPVIEHRAWPEHQLVMRSTCNLPLAVSWLTGGWRFDKNKPQTSYSVFKEALRSLCLKEFPCGVGSWRDKKAQFADGQYTVTTKDYGVQYEKMEVLQEYLKSGTWDADTSWSGEAPQLRSLAIIEPWKMEGKKGERFVHQFFKTLRIIDKRVTEIDEHMLRFSNLEELISSANFLKTVPADRLPPKLQVLELCTNCIESVVSLCKRPPPLLHLGLSYNKLHNTAEYKYFTVDYWPRLMSLDLSYNKLTKLVDLVDNLATLNSLRNLVLQGNPLCLIAGYRGHVVDGLRSVTILDDVNVSADERHHFKGLAKKRDLIRDEAIVSVTFEGLAGTPVPEELQELEDRPEFPVVVTSYLVRYKMLEEAVGESTSVPPTAQSERAAVTMEGDSLSEVCDYETSAKEWVAENPIDLAYKKVHVMDDLVALRDFLTAPLLIDVMQLTVRSWPDADGDGAAQPPDTPKSGKSKGKEKDAKPKDKKTDKKPSRVGQASSSMVGMRKDPPVYTKLGTCTVDLQAFLEGEDSVAQVCYCGGGPKPATEQEMQQLVVVKQPSVSDQDLKSTKNSKSSKGLKTAKRKKSEKEPDAKADGKGGRKSSKGTKSKPGSGRKTAVDETTANDAPPPPPPAILLNLRVHLRRWSTAADALRGDEAA